MKSTLLLILSLFIVMPCSCQTNKEQLIKETIQRMMHDYPESTLRDIYKSFFQDRFGPEHIINDSASTIAYIKEEFASQQKFEGRKYEPTGYLGNYYRVNLSVIKDDIVPLKTFADVFIRSAKSSTLPTIDSWKKDWSQINNVIKVMSLKLDNYKSDSTEICNLLNNGEYAIHHSRKFVEAYNPHYRIIKKELFEKYILPLIDKKSSKQK